MYILTYNQLVEDYVYRLELIFRVNNNEERRKAFNELYGFKNIIEEDISMSRMPIFAQKIEPKVIESNILPKILNSINSTFDMIYNEIPFNQILGKMHAELDEYKKLMENQ